MRQRDRSERRNSQRKCFQYFNCVIDHLSICFFFYINSLHCFKWSILYYLLHLLRSANNLIAILIFNVNMFFKKIIPEKEFSEMYTYIIWKMFYKEIQGQAAPGSAFLEFLEALIMKTSPMCVSVSPKNLWMRGWFYIYIYIYIYPNGLLKTFQKIK